MTDVRADPHGQLAPDREQGQRDYLVLAVLVLFSRRELGSRSR